MHIQALSKTFIRKFSQAQVKKADIHEYPGQLPGLVNCLDKKVVFHIWAFYVVGST